MNLWLGVDDRSMGSLSFGKCLGYCNTIVTYRIYFSIWGSAQNLLFVVDVSGAFL